MIFYRQKTLLALLQTLGGNLSATDFQKYLFLFTRLCEKEKSYDFVPYRFGCYSFQATADKQKLIDKGYLKDVSGWELAKTDLSYVKRLNKGDDKKMVIFAERYGHLRGKPLIRHVYENYPYYAINSEIADDILSAEKHAAVKKAKPARRHKPSFSTIGYEGGSVEVYLNKLIENDVRLLVDVRKNPLSRKYGFSKRTLSTLTNNLGIEYVHLPDLGITSADRKSLHTQQDYDKLFARYDQTVLKEQTGALQQLLTMYKSKKRLAITCFERDHYQCHRSRVANAIEAMSNGEIVTQHL